MLWTVAFLMVITQWPIACGCRCWCGVIVLQDDFGWADADWHRPVGWKEAATPHMLELLRSGVELDNMYAFKFCAPTRSSIQSGRNPIHVNVQNYQPVVWDSADPNRDKVSGYAGIPTKMTGMSAVLKSAGYATHYTGKWDCGMAMEAHTPKGVLVWSVHLSHVACWPPAS